MALSRSIYKLTDQFPSKEKFGLISQMRRCSVSIPSNIAEGTSRKTIKHFDYFLVISIGSVFELETQLILSHDLHYIDKKDFQRTTKEIQDLKNMIFGFRNKILKKVSKSKSQTIRK